MKVPVVLMACALLFAGCVSKNDAFPAVETASTDGSPPEPEPAPTSDEVEDEPGAKEQSPAPAEQEESPSPEPPADDEQTPPAVPEPQPWTLSQSVRLGWVAGVGAGSAAPQNVGQGETDAEHCPDASFALPSETQTLRVTVVDVNETGAGTYDLQVGAPDGTLAHLEPFHAANGVPGAVADITVEDPVAGEWTLHAEPWGPVAGRVFVVTLEAQGLSTGAAPELVAAGAC